MTEPKRFTTIRNAQDAIDHWWPIWFPEPEVTTTPPTMVWDASDQDVIDKLRSARNATKFEALYDRGETGDYAHNESEADLALLSMLSFYTQDPGQLDRLFRGSRLYRPKWERPDYRDMTISRALDRGAYYEPPANSDAGFTVYRSSEEEADPETGEVTSKVLIFNQTDLGNAKRLVHHHGQHIRYVHAWKTWLIWTGSRWKIDGSGEIFRLAKDTAQRIYAESTHIEDEKARKRLLDWAKTSESGARIREMIGLAASEEGVPVEVSDLDRDPMLLNVQNGTINLKTGDLQPHDPEDNLTKLAPIPYDPHAIAPTWTSFLTEIMASDTDVIAYLQRAIGYSLGGDVSERKMFILHGEGRNGKSTFLETIRSLLGDYAVRSPNELMIAPRMRSGGPSEELAQLAGIRFTYVSETGEFDRMDESKIKDMVSGDAISARALYQARFDFVPQFKLWAGTNHRPDMRSNDQALWDRINLIPFDVRIPEDRVDRTLKQRLRAEMPGILAWAVQGCLLWQKIGLQSPARVQAATDDYRESMDTLGAFMSEECVTGDGHTILVSLLYETYATWARDNGIQRPWAKNKFSTMLVERGFSRERFGKNRERHFMGISLKTFLNDHDDDLDAVE